MGTEALMPMRGGGKELVEPAAATAPPTWQMTAPGRAPDCAGTGDSPEDIDQWLSDLGLLSSMTEENDILVCPAMARRLFEDEGLL